MTTIKKGFTLGLVILLAQAWLLVNVKAIYPEDTLGQLVRFLTYFMLYVMVFAVADLRDTLLSIKFSRIGQLVAWGGGTLLILATISNFFRGSELSTTSIFLAWFGITLPMVIFHTLVVAPIEEYWFRDFLEKRVGRLWSCVFFGLFHFVVYFGNVIAMVWAMILGYVLSLIKERYDKEGDNMENTGVHAGINLFVEGMKNLLNKVNLIG